MSETTPAAPAAQAKYQVRFDQGPDAVHRIADGVHVVVWVDQTTDAAADSPADAPIVPRAVLDAAPHHAAVLAANLRDAAAAAAWILAEQERLGRRAYLAIVAAGRADGGFAADDVLAAGAVIDALIELGIDDTSPEAAVASAAYAGLRRAVAHLATASAEGRRAIEEGVDPASLRREAARDASASVRVARAGAPA
ncbi:2-phosphosulfolactate phosphatase [Agromyces sp. C10]|uniref:2-phosphosulfolactate phosphatase n=1 Tax=Agromyces sp. C10 TaxID=2935077 RepID=UPI00200AF442|nr:2-phosphosulfolactate phosphatase [Agromyces sp. C10]MCK8609170.1 2-phosphosulfolactate phosphatase [Agromyces sp. C10]